MTKLHILKRPSEKTPNFYETENVKSYKEYIVVAHYFLPASCVDFYVVEYDKENDEVMGGERPSHIVGNLVTPVSASWKNWNYPFQSKKEIPSLGICQYELSLMNTGNQRNLGKF